MKIKCIYNKWSDLPEALDLNLNASRNTSDFHIDIGTEYTVYAMTLKDDLIWYYICDRAFSYYPRWKPSPFFDIVDQRLSRYWIYSFKKLPDYDKSYPIFAFPEWANNHPDFYDKLSDGEKKEMNLFAFYKESMDLEFPDSSISQYAQIGNNDWLICPQCIDAWQQTTKIDALVRCPKCRQLWNNPLYSTQ